MNEETPATADPDSSRGGGRGEGRWPQILAVVLAAGLAWTAPVAAGRAFRFADRAIAEAGENPPPSVSIRLGRLVDAQETARAALAVALLGLVLGVASCSAPPRGVPRRPFAAIALVRAAAIGLGLGAAAGAGGSLASGLRQVGDQDLVVASGLQGLVWGVVGGAAGAAAGGRLAEGPHRGRAVARGILAGVAWGVAYPVLLAVASPWAYAERLLPEGRAASIAWSSLGVAAIGLSVGLLGGPGARRIATTDGGPGVLDRLRPERSSTPDRGQE